MLLNKEYGFKAENYTIGVLIFYLLVGKLPFDGDSQERVAKYVLYLT